PAPRLPTRERPGRLALSAAGVCPGDHKKPKGVLASRPPCGILDPCRPKHEAAKRFQHRRSYRMTTHRKGITRRDFVPSASPAAPWGNKRRRAARKLIRWCSSGRGTMTAAHRGHFRGQKDFQVLAVCDVDKNRREHAKKTVEDRYGKDKKGGKYKGCAAYTD